MSDPLGLSEGVKGLTSGLDSARESSKSLTKQVEAIKKDGLDVATQMAQEGNVSINRAKELLNKQ